MYQFFIDSFVHIVLGEKKQEIGCKENDKIKILSFFPAGFSAVTMF